MNVLFRVTGVVFKISDANKGRLRPVMYRSNVCELDLVSVSIYTSRSPIDFVLSLL